jgi:RNA polymerase sigma factor (sigma-70 family)
MTTTTTTTTTIEKLSSRLNRYSYCITGPEMTSEDSYQEMVLALLEKAADTTTTFFDQAEAYQVRYASWQAMKQAQAGRTYLKYVTSLETTTAEHFGVEDELDIFEVFPAAGPSLEDQVIADETASEIMAALSELTLTNRTVAAMIYLGYSQSEIAARLGVSKPAISERKATISKYLSRVSENWEN